MSQCEQLEELDALQAIYNGSEEVMLSAAITSIVTGPQDNEDNMVTLEARFFSGAACGKLQLCLKARLPPAYLAEDTADCQATPSFELESACMTEGRLSQLCKCLDEMVLEHGNGPILFSWIEWLRTESRGLGEVLEELDPRAIVVFERESAADGSPGEWQNKDQACANCHQHLHPGDCICLWACSHVFCSKCMAAVMQIEAASDAKHCCPLPECRMQLSHSDVQELEAPPDPWMAVSSHILGTQFEDLIVFCPYCESLGKDIPVLMSSPAIRTTAESNHDTGMCHCKCSCGLNFCGACRSPCHPGEACLAVASRAVRMSKRRPTLSTELQALAAKMAEEVQALEAEAAKEAAAAWLSKRKEAGDVNFNTLRRLFLESHEEAIMHGLESVFGPVRLLPTPLHQEVQDSFMRSVQECPKAEIRPAFHGTDAKNHASIYRHGLLVPGVGNRLRVVHGAVHGQGVYTANIDAAWLSKGFCSGPAMFVCGVLQTDCVRHVGDAMVVGRADHVTPLFFAEAISKLYAVNIIPVVAPARSSKISSNPVRKPVASTKEEKSEKFKARLARRSKRY
jgi:hypothetical protein